MMAVLIFGILFFLIGAGLAVFCFEQKFYDAGLGATTMAIVGIVIICIFLFAPICELSDANVQTINGEKFLVSVNECHKNINPSKTWTNTYFTELAE
jgi:hypothetical protein